MRPRTTCHAVHALLCRGTERAFAVACRPVYFFMLPGGCSGLRCRANRTVNQVVNNIPRISHTKESTSNMEVISTEELLFPVLPCAALLLCLRWICTPQMRVALQQPSWQQTATTCL